MGEKLTQVELPAASIALLAFVRAAPADGGVLAELLAGGHTEEIERRLRELESLGCVTRDESRNWWCTWRGSQLLAAERVICLIEPDATEGGCQ